MLPQLTRGVFSIPFNISVFKFPKSDGQELRDRWISVLKRKDAGWNPKNFGVCELDFSLNDFHDQQRTFRKTGWQSKTLKPTAAPSIFNCYPE